MAAESRSAGDSYDNIEPLFEKIAALDPGDPRRSALRAEVIDRALPLAEHIARRFSGRGESFEDLLQVARLGLVQAADRFDVGRGSSFLAFAVPTIMGEVRRHFRDNTWAVRVPRRTKEIQGSIGATVEELSQRLGRMPRAREIAAELGIDVVEVTQALIAGNAYQSSSLDSTAGDDGENTPLPLSESLGAEEPSFEFVDDYLAVRPLIAELPERERQVLVMRFFEGKTQTQIADVLGVSQMHVSRILSKTLHALREQALRD
ncbi:RNA polymerase sigma factor SigF [Nocardia farcinica]|uniref:RNA polymerase sigma factor SigF n=1 Tax=Nocardia farcinica TaxID=37329 RepID=UPI001894EF41|nr:RNA polymerase sigma factor SigF [Nocardia farcinica]MBF6260863.1 RNA polymerase sigma factor SigF [Nocardia farcinica]MBF6279467.1 RNA polymerase sigma factor SigF [Nocardia farcinica]MBF6303873.1 RNA polymerase sigma factor SigF [Nocardia farcinica]MBF6388915.1 RNA polymerase sigma factor SigF [Nocardia farcinica]MBF6489575.1 RNA polymerase sigma factor SigF [Nocardia farcinica]